MHLPHLCRLQIKCYTCKQRVNMQPHHSRFAITIAFFSVSPKKWGGQGLGEAFGAACRSLREWARRARAGFCVPRRERELPLSSQRLYFSLEPEQCEHRLESKVLRSVQVVHKSMLGCILRGLSWDLKRQVVAFGSRTVGFDSDG